MADDILECRVRNQNNYREILSPHIGRAILHIAIDQDLLQGSIIGKLWCLNRSFLLKLPDDIDGRVISFKNDERMIKLAYNEVFLVLDQLQKSQDAAKNLPIEKNQKSINAPMDGMVYLSSSPDAPPFVKIGDEICHGQTIGLIEVMKSFYPVKYQGTKKVIITGVHVKNASPINSGAPIFSIRE
jgi:acetyl-CoA carboxylase biotin carboxyl carrier protein